MLASLARVVVLGKDTLARGYAWREVAVTLTATSVVLRDNGLAVRLRACQLLSRPVLWRMSGEKLEG